MPLPIATFTFETIAEEVATTFAKEIKGKNGKAAIGCCFFRANLWASLNHWHFHQRYWIRDRARYRQTRQFGHHHWLQCRQVR